MGKKLKRRQLLKLLAVIIFSDGYINHSSSIPSIRLTTLASSTSQHKLFHLLCESVFGQKPRSYTRKRKTFGKERVFTDSEFKKSGAAEELYALSPTFKTTPGPKTTKKEYLSSRQPTLDFILSEPRYIRELALRIFFDFDGSIVPTVKLKRKRDRKKGKTYEYYQVQLEIEAYISETNPSLSKDVKRLCESLGLRSCITKRASKWSGIEGVRISELSSIIEFVRIGPVTDIAISSKSKRFMGIPKNQVCAALKELLESDFRLSYSFKNRNEALKQKTYLNTLLQNKVRNSPVV